MIRSRVLVCGGCVHYTVHVWLAPSHSFASALCVCIITHKIYYTHFYYRLSSTVKVGVKAKRNLNKFVSQQFFCQNVSPRRFTDWVSSAFSGRKKEGLSIHLPMPRMPSFFLMGFRTVILIVSKIWEFFCYQIRKNTRKVLSLSISFTLFHVCFGWESNVSLHVIRAALTCFIVWIFVLTWLL